MWALGEIVKAQAGILEGDFAPTTSRPRSAVPSKRSFPVIGTRAWIEPQLPRARRPGRRRASSVATGGDRPSLLGGGSSRGWPTSDLLVLVVEDLHWADESMLDFVDELVEWVTDAPLLVVGTARPELLTRRPVGAGGNSTRRPWRFLPSSDGRRRRSSAGCSHAPCSADAQQKRLEHAGGNPLYAEESADCTSNQAPRTFHCARRCRNHRRPPRRPRGRREGAPPGCGGGRQGLLEWLARTRAGDGVTTLHALERRGFVRSERRSRSKGERVRVCACSRPRRCVRPDSARRARRETQVAEWITRSAGPRTTPRRSPTTGSPQSSSSGRAADRRATRKRPTASAKAGDRAASLYAYATAAANYAGALELAGNDDVELLFKRADALFTSATKARPKR